MIRLPLSRIKPVSTNANDRETERNKLESRLLKPVNGLGSIMQLKARNEEIHNKQLKVIEVCVHYICNDPLRAC